MSRETDSSSSGPKGRGGAAYPSGTPPYGTDGGPEAGADAERPGTDKQSDEPETQTTLTTRVRINIPGSRPIPPLVMRTPVNEGEASGESSPLPRGGSEPAGPNGSAPTPPAAPAAEPAPERSEPEEQATSDWFAPRKSRGGAKKPGGPPAGTPGPGAAGTAGTSGGPPSRGPSSGPAASGTPAGGTPAAGTPAGGPRPGGPRSGSSGAPGTPGSGPGAPGARPTPPGGPQTPATGSPAPSTGAGPWGNGGAPPTGSPGPGRPGAAGPRPPAAGGPPVPPSGPTTGPATGDGLVLPPGFRQQGDAEPPRMSDDTAVLTPQKPGPGGPVPGGGHVSGDTLNSGIPVVPTGQGPGQQSGPGGPFAGGPAAPHTPHTPPVLPEPPQQQGPPPAAGSRPAAPAKRGRNKLVLAGAGVFTVLVLAYGAGLLMNHSDVPKGTTVLGVDIGGGTHDAAVKKLDAALGKRATQDVRLNVDGDEAALKPEKAGLSLNYQATVRNAASSDYNPVSVIGSLFGGEREVEPEIPTDEEKLADALGRVAGTSGSAAEGTIKFQPGKAVPVYGKTGKRLNPQGSITAVEEAYRSQLETGESKPVQLPVSSASPKVSKAEVDRMMKSFAEPAMSGLVTVQTDPAHSVSFSPEKSIYKFLTVVPTSEGKLVEKFDPVALKKLYGTTFDGVTVTKGDGSKKPVSWQEVAGALREALRGTTAADRIGTIQTNGN
ncbi:hypothetical protein DSC45_16495 [Streptomyces sp. YIM 130001]|uniref:hypothetical protein n=1 Tax=Streptomyces sp. YIM 130001 TaxID=2259644 RepID=UPI000E64F3A0|nr:hypothetical protein [Streptomyces sp. YIM 130001]RII15841.1 hypothetical protein DSC45_16495 [Streptomyces sp. YIM 130001]